MRTSTFRRLRGRRHAQVDSSIQSARTVGSRGTSWSRRNIGEMLDGVLTPLSQSLARHYQHEVHPRCFAAMGLADTGQSSAYYTFFAGRLYANVPYFAYLLSQAPLWREPDDFIAMFSDPTLDPSTFANPYGRLEGRRALARSITHWLRTEARSLVRSPLRVRSLQRASEASRVRFERHDISSRSRRELGESLEIQLAAFADAYELYLPIVFDAMTVHGMLDALLERWGLGPQRAALATRLDLASSEAGAVLELVEYAEREPGLVELLADGTELGALARAEDPRLRNFEACALEPFLREYGDRSTREMELTTPRWWEQPAPIHARVHAALTNPNARAELSRRRSEFEQPIPADALARLAPPRRLLFDAALPCFDHLVELRLDGRRPVVAALARVRSLLLEAGRRLQNRGLLTELDELAYLQLDELRAWLRAPACAQLRVDRATIDARRRDHARVLRGPTPPLSIIGSWTPPSAPRVPEGDTQPALSARS